jgi:hypothetical protein
VRRRSLQRVESVNRGERGLGKVIEHNKQGVVSQNQIGAPARRTRTTRPNPEPITEEVIEREIEQEAIKAAADVPVEKINLSERFTKFEGVSTKKARAVLEESEQIMADTLRAAGLTDDGIRGFQRVADRVDRIRLQATKTKSGNYKYNGLWEERNVVRTRRTKTNPASIERIEKRMTLQMNRADHELRNEWVDAHNKEFSRINNPLIRTGDLKLSDDGKDILERPQYIDNPDFIDSKTKRWEHMEEWKKKNPEPSAVYEAGAEEIVQTYFHELVHVLDLGDDAYGVTPGLERTLRAAVSMDGITKRAAEIYASGKGDTSFWYAAEGVRGKPAETVAEVVRMYFFGDRKGPSLRRVNPLQRSPEQWRETYPDLAEWVEKEVIPRLEDIGRRSR